MEIDEDEIRARRAADYWQAVIERRLDRANALPRWAFMRRRELRKRAYRLLLMVAAYPRVAMETAEMRPPVTDTAWLKTEGG